LDTVGQATTDFTRQYQQLEVAAQALPELSKTDPGAANLLKANIQAKAQELMQRQQQLINAGQHIDQVGKAKKTHSLQLELLDLVPELAEPEARQKLVRWASKHYRAPESQILSIMDPRRVAQGWDAMVAEEKAAKAKVVKAKVAKFAMADRGLGSETSSKDAREALRRSGHPDDALNYWNLKRAERRYV
jgi:hypothetical protein